MENNSKNVTYTIEVKGDISTSPDTSMIAKIVEKVAKEQLDKVIEPLKRQEESFTFPKQEMTNERFLSNAYSSTAKKVDDFKNNTYDKPNNPEKQYGIEGLMPPLDFLKPEEKKKELIETLKDYRAELLKLEEEYKKQRELLKDEYKKAGTKEEKQTATNNLKALDIKYQNDIKKSIGGLEKLSAGLGQYTAEGLDQIVESVNALDLSMLSDDEKKKVEAFFTKLREDNPFKQMGRDFSNVIDSIKNGGDVKAAFGGLEKSFGAAKGKISETLKPFESLFYSTDKEQNEKNQYQLENIKYVAGNVEQIAGGVFDIGKGAAGILSGTDIIGGTMSVIKGVGSIISIGSKVKQMNKEARDKVDKFNRAAEIGASEYDIQKRTEAVKKIDKKGGTLAYDKNLKETLLGTNGQKQANQETYNKLYAQLADEKYVSGQTYKHGTWFRKAEVKNQYETLKDKSYDDLEKLSMEGKLEGKALEIFNQLKKLKAEGENIDKIIKEQEEAMKQAFTGTTASSIADSLLKGFAEGKRSAADFANDFEKMMNDAVLSGVKLKALEEPLAKWYDDFAEKTADGEGLTEAEIEELREKYNLIIEDAANKLETAQAITGLKKKEDPEAERTVSSKGLAAMSQDSAGELNGRFTAMLFLQDQMNNNLQKIAGLETPLTSGLGTLSQIAANTSHCVRLNSIDDSIEKMNKSIETIVRDGLYLKK